MPTSRRLFVDTVYLVALINPRDQYPKLAVSLAEIFEARPTLTTEAVILEIGNALAHDHRESAARLIDGFFESEDCKVARLTPELFDEAFALYKSCRDKTWGLVDCVSFVVMRREGVTEALTFDRHFTQAGFRALMGVPSNGRGHSSD